MSRWFRHYAGMMRDDKLVRVAIRSKQTIERVLWIWGAILESAAEIDDNGRYDFDAAEAAYFLRADEADVCAVVDALADAGRLAGGAVVKWSNRQFSSDRSKDRVAAHRERKRAEIRGTDVTETTDERGVTLQKRHRNSPETELELDIPLSNDNGAAENPVDPEKVMFDAGIAMLRQHGVSESRARPLLGKWRKNHGSEAVIAALGAAQRAGAVDPVGYIEGRWRATVRAEPAVPL